MVVQVEVAQIVVAVLQDNQYLVVVEELAQHLSVFVVVQTVHVGVEPNLAAAQSRVSVTLQTDAVNSVFGEQVTLRGATLDHHLREVLLDKYLLDLLRWVECYLNHLGLAVRVGGEVHHAAAIGALCQVVLLVASHRGNVESLDEAGALLTIAVNGIVDGARVVLLEHVDIHDVLAHEEFLGYAYNLVFTVFVEDDDIVEIRAVTYKLVLLQSGTDKAIVAVDVQLLVGLGHLG